MDEVAPTRIVVDHVGEIERDEMFTKGNESPPGSRSPSPPPVFRARSRRTSFQWMVETSPTAMSTRASPVSSERQDSLPPSTAFAKLVRTVQFIKKWSKRAEREPDSAREEFLDRFKMNGPGADSAFGRSISEEETEREEGRRDWCYLWRIVKRRRHLLLIWKPSGQWLYRSVNEVGGRGGVIIFVIRSLPNIEFLLRVWALGDNTIIAGIISLNTCPRRFAQCTLTLVLLICMANWRRIPSLG